MTPDDGVRSAVAEPAPDPFAMKWEAPAHRVPLPRFFLARYPVTVAQFGMYVRAVVRGEWKPSRPDGGRCEDLDLVNLAAVPTLPVMWVSWYDAMDYSRWLAAQLRERIAHEQTLPEEQRTVPKPLVRVLMSGDESSHGSPWVVTLPSEAEWEKGARGSETAWMYPWQGDWDPMRANGGSPALDDRPSAAGAFGQGASPFGFEDMSGNVWEWTRSLWGPDGKKPTLRYPYEPDYDGRGRENVMAAEDFLRVVRGGSFLDDPRGLRSAFRGWLRPRFRDHRLGFRVVVSPFAFDPLISDPSGL